MWIGVALAFLVVAAAVASWRYSETTRAARAEQLAAIEQLVDRDQYGAAFAIAQPLMTRCGALDPALAALWKQIVMPGTPLTVEPGATLSYKAYNDTTEGWIVAGQTPINEPLDLPRDVLRIRLEKSGFQTGDFVVANPGPSVRSAKSLAE